jgi:hypothetical protein
MVKNKTVDKTQEYLESKIIDYQNALENKQYAIAEDVYDKICKLYEPEKFIHIWERQYSYLYDSPEDFKQDYMRIFVQTLRKWKPKDVRAESRYNGTGTFKNYFWGSLSHNYINLIKSAEGAAKRNLTTRCPICSEWHNPLSTHIIKKHPDLLWNKLAESQIDIETFSSCPFCNSHIYKGKHNLPTNELVKRHILSKHLHMLFEIFNEKYPTIHSGSVKHISIDMGSDSEEPFTVYDITPAPATLLDKIVNSDLTPIQQMIIENIISKKNHVVKYSKKEYKCSEDEFDREMSGLRDKLIYMEDIIGKY